MINLNHLRIFYHAAKHLSFTEAAKDLFVTQPAVTNQIRAFEDHWKLKLFRKRGQKIRLTEEGKTLYEYARKVFEYEKKIEDVMNEMRNLKLGVLRVGTTRTYARSLMPLLITRFLESYPNIKVKIDEGGSLDIIRNLLNFRNEVAIIVKAEDNPDICFIPFCNEEILVIMAPSHHLAQKKDIQFTEIAHEPIIIKETGSGTRKILNELFARHKFTPHILMETGNTEFIKQLVQRGEGISLLSREAVSSELHEKKLVNVPLKGQKIFLSINIAYLKNETLSLPAQEFVQILRKSLGENVLPEGIGAFKEKLLGQ